MNVHQLRRRWKPIKERLAAERADHPTSIRFHRACSWLQRVERMDEDDLDMKLACQWIAFNALYGQWDERRAEPRSDRESWRAFFERIIELDRDELLPTVLRDHKKLVLAILDDAYLGGFFWKDPSTERALRTTRDRRDAATWYLEERWGLILDNAIEHVYMLRCQLIHGAATHGSKLNRGSLRRCAIMMGHVLPAVLTVWTDHGADVDWGPMCYPPLQ